MLLFGNYILKELIHYSFRNCYKINNYLIPYFVTNIDSAITNTRIGSTSFLQRKFKIQYKWKT